MPRTLLAAPLLALLLCPSLRAEPPKPSPADVPWADAAHKPYFNYQAYLARLKLAAETKETWAKLKAAERLKRVADGEAFLKKRLEEILASRYNGESEAEFIEAVWGKDAAQALQKVGAARQLKDPDQLKKALAAVKALAVKVGDVQVDWDKLFDAAAQGRFGGLDEALSEPVPAVSADKVTDYTAVKPEKDFLDSLADKEVTEALATDAAFSKFLDEKKVPEDARPGLVAMYQVISKATGDEKKNLAHILPTVVRFILDGKKIVEEASKPGTLGFAVDDDYGQPQKVAITPAVKDADPVIVGTVLAHEFQHVYDMYTGRFYTLDSELRGFKVNVMYTRVLRQNLPAKYKKLEASKDNDTRAYMADEIETERAYAKGPEAFRAMVALGHHYNNWSEGTFQGRVSLRETLAPNAAPRDLAETQFMLKWSKDKVAALEKKLDAARAARDKNPSQDADDEVVSVTTDLAAARDTANKYDKLVSIKSLRLSNMRREQAWLDKKYAGQKDPPAFDLELPVDKAYYKKK